MSEKPDKYSRIEYRALIAWDERIKREQPLIEAVLKSAPSRRVLDLGSGTGEHARFIASKGYEVVGVDTSPSMIEKSLEIPSTAKFVLGDMTNLPDCVEGRFGAAICLGNALPHLVEEDDLLRFAKSVRAVLLPDAPLLVQLLNYDRIRSKNERNLPLNFRPDPDDPDTTLVFLRLLNPQPDGKVIFVPSTLRLRLDSEEPLELISSRRVEVRGWTRRQLDDIFARAGFRLEVFGSFARDSFNPEESRDVVFIAR